MRGRLFWGIASTVLAVTATTIGLPAFAAADVVAKDRRIDWLPGIPGGIPNYPACFDAVKDFGATPDDTTDDTAAIQQALDACPAGQAVYLPAGTYRISQPLLITPQGKKRDGTTFVRGRGVVLRGAGPDKTKILNVGSPAPTTIWIRQRSTSSPRVDILSGYSKGSQTITVADASSIPAGSYVFVSQLNDPEFVTPRGYNDNFCSWCGLGESGQDGERAMTQIVRVTARSGSTLTLARPLYFTFRAALRPQVKRVDLFTGAGVEDLYVEQVGSRGADGNILIQGAAYSWVKNVQSRLPWAAHVRIWYSYGCEIRDSFLNEARDVRSGRGYGLFAFGPNSDHLFENNIIYRARHSMVFEGGGSGNVFGYNYALDVTSEVPTWLHSDSITHGAHPYMNLFEGNVFAKLAPDNTFGSSSHNTWFRNHVTRESTGAIWALWAVDIEQNNQYQNLVGNVLCQPGCVGTIPLPNIIGGNVKTIYRIGYSSPGSTAPPADSRVEATLYRHGNFDYITGSTTWDPTVAHLTLPPSLYLSAKPAFFGSLPWPIIGPDVSPMVSDLPAKIRYRSRSSGSQPPATPTGLRVQ